jgi:hypothetical protein
MVSSTRVILVAHPPHLGKEGLCFGWLGRGHTHPLLAWLDGDARIGNPLSQNSPCASFGQQKNAPAGLLLPME